MDKLFIIFSLLVLTSCKTTYHEVRHVEKYPLEWSDVVIYQEDHWHFQGKNKEWTCVELEADTIYLDMKDTLYIESVERIYYTKNKKR